MVFSGCTAFSRRRLASTGGRGSRRRLGLWSPCWMDELIGRFSGRRPSSPPCTANDWRVCPGRIVAHQRWAKVHYVYAAEMRRLDATGDVRSSAFPAFLLASFTPEKRTLRPSAIVGCERIASFNTV